MENLIKIKNILIQNYTLSIEENYFEISRGEIVSDMAYYESIIDVFIKNIHLFSLCKINAEEYEEWVNVIYNDEKILNSIEWNDVPYSYEYNYISTNEMMDMLDNNKIDYIIISK